MKRLIYLVLALATASAVWAAPLPSNNIEGWSFSKAEVIKDQQRGLFVRLDLQVDRGGASLGNTVKLEPGSAHALKIKYQSSDVLSARDNGSWIYIAFRDTTDKGVGEECHLLEKTTSWAIKTISFTPPAGAAKVFLSFRQQNRKGTLDIQSIELTPANADAILTLSPANISAMDELLTPGEKLSPEGERSPLDGNIFLPYLNGTAPKIVHDLGTETVDGVLVHKVVFRSMTVGGETQDVYAIIARPSAAGNYPGVPWVHGGHGHADAGAVIRYAKAGYVAIAPDLLGIAEPKDCPNSVGPWTRRYGRLGWTVKPDPTANETFDAVVTALQSFDLLIAQPSVIKDRIAVAGISMGGYTTTMISGLLGKRVRAAFSKYGCGFYDRGSTWTKDLADLPDDQRESWLHHFDAGRRATGIQAPYFNAAAASDHFFWPPAVNATLSAIPRASNQAYAPANHRLTGIPGEDKLDLLYLGYWLKGEGEPFPKVTVDRCEIQPDGGKKITFSVQATLPVQTATVFVTAGGDSWEKSTWEPIPSQTAGDKQFQVTIPANKITKKGAWFVNVSDARPATAGSLVYGMDASGSGPALIPLSVNP